MTETSGEKQMTEKGEPDSPETKMEIPGLEKKKDFHPVTGNLREASYVVLFIAAVFAVNAMETGSYRTPWPVALFTAGIGLVLYGYSWYLQFHSKKKESES